jgi:hypothetical protein
VNVWREIGPAVLLQVQRGPLKVSHNGRKLYKPEGVLVSCDRFELSCEGVTASLDGQTVWDVHHARHPNSRNRDTNPLSIGFTGHYAQLQARFGSHLKLGIAGENIIVQSDRVLTEDDFAGRVAFRAADGSLTVIENLYAIPPCRPFASFCLDDLEDEIAPQTMAETLRWLHTGLRGFCGQPVGEAVREIRVGDIMLIAS